MVATLVKQSQQDSQLAFYDQFVKGCLSQLKSNSSQVTLSIDAQSQEYTSLLNMVKSAVTDNQCIEISKRHDKL